jgi:hypothetical protein
MRCKSEKRRGTIAVLVAVSLVAIFGVVAIALDGGLLLDDHRGVQAAADAAALAAADDLFNNYGTKNGLDPSGTGKASALSTAAANGYSNDGVTSLVTVNIPPTSGNFVGKAGYAEVIVQFNQKREFSTIFGSGTLPVTARAVACGIPGNIGILILHPHLQGACEIDGNVNILQGGQIFANSDNTVPNDAASSYATGSIYLDNTATLSTGGLNVYNSLVNNGTVTYTNNGGLNTFTVPVPDPLASIPEPTTSGLTNYGSVTLSGGFLQPGIYTNITVTSGTVTLQPGIYYLASGGSLDLDGGSLQGTGVMIVDNTGSDNMLGMSDPGKGPINLTPPTPTSGGSWPIGTTSTTYNGISLWVPRSRTAEVHVESSFNLTMSGTWYAQSGEFDIRPDGASTVFNTGNYICSMAEWGQGYDSVLNMSNGIINMNPGSSAPNLRPTLVE